MKKIITLLLGCCLSTTFLYSQTVIHSENFESGWGFWNDGGDDCRILSNSPLNNSNSIELRDNSWESLMSTDEIDLTSYASIDITFDFRTSDFSDTHDFFLQFSNDGGSNYATIKTFVKPADFDNNINYLNETVRISNGGTYTFTANSKFRFRSSADNDSDFLYIDNILIEGYHPGPEINILGNNVSIVNGDSTPSVADFTDYGSVGIGATLSKTFFVQNNGTADLTISNIVLSNTTDFSITGTPFSTPVAAGGSTTFTLTFNASTIGTKNSTVTIFNNDVNESSYQFTLKASAQQNFFDSDGDGIFDNIDIDDDNDGIKDTDEENTCRNSPIATAVNYKFLNETFGSLPPGSRTTINTLYNATTSYCYEPGTDSGSSCGTSWILDDGEYVVVSKITGTSASDPENIHGNLAWTNVLDHTADDGDAGGMAVFNAAWDPGVFYETTITGILPNVPISYSFWVLNIMAQSTYSGSILPNVTVQFVDLSGTIITSIDTGQIGRCSADINDNSCSANAWQNFNRNDINLGNRNEFIVRFINNAPGGGGNDLALDDIIISQTLCDTDSDGVADVFDLDSDNDGIPDVVESGLGNLSNGTAKIPYPTGWIDANGNGMHDLMEGNIALDTDGDGVPNYLDLDSDNDSIFDVDESGAGNSGDINFQNGDGDINGDGVGDGPDTDAVREKDFDSNGTSEYFTDGILDSYDYYNGGAFATAYGNSNQGLGNTYFVKDTDNDGIPDYMDTTSDGATFDISHTLYASLDAVNNGVIDGNADIDHDGILDNFDTNTAVFGSPRDLDRKLHLYFDGRNDYGEDASDVLSGLSEASIMGWIKIDPSATGIQVLFGQNNFYVQLMSDKKVEAKAGAKTVSTTASIATGQWVNIAATYSASNLKLYINGELINSTSGSGSLAIDAFPFTVGRKPAANSNYYHGYMDEVRVFDKALTADELHKMVYQEIEENLGNVRGAVIPRNITNYIDISTTPIVLPWSNLKRYYRMDAYKDDIIDDLTTGTIDVGAGAKIYNMKIIEVQNAPLPFVTQIGETTLPNAVNIPSSGVNGNDAITYDWSIVKIEHQNIAYNANQKHLGLFVNSQDTSLNPIEFSIQDNTELNVSWYLKLDGFIDLDGESQLVQGDDSILDEDSAGFIERDQQGTANSFNYNYWSSSVGPIGTGIGSNNANYAISGVLKDGTTAASPGNINFLPAHWAADSGITSPIILSSYWLYTFNGTNNDYGSWNSVNQNTLLLAGEGYTMKGTSGNVSIANDQNYVFKGKPNNGEIKLPISAGNDRLIGNPYASAIDADEFIKDNIKESINSKAGRNTKNIFNGALYFWDHFGEINSHILREYVGGYATRNLIGGAKAISNDYRINANNAIGTKIPQQFIPVGQGFFVNAVLDASLLGTTTTIDGGDIVFKNSQRVFNTEASGNSVFMKGVNTKSAIDENEISAKKKKTETGAKIWLQFDSPTGYHRQLLVGLDKNASNHFDLGYDAPIADIGKEDMFWTFDGSKFVIQGVNNFDKKQELPLGLKIFKAGLARIKIDASENLDKKVSVYIKDKLTGKSYLIDKNPFEINLEPGDYLDRFSVTFKAGKKNDKNDDDDDDNDDDDDDDDDHDKSEQNNADSLMNSNEFHIFMNNTTGELQITKPVASEVVSISVYNYLGQSVRSWNTRINEPTVYLPVKVSSGAYIVEINTKNGSVVQKVIVE